MEEEKHLAFVRNIISLKPMLYRSLGKPFPQNSGITPGSYYIMLALSKHESLTMSELGNKMMISRPNVTALVNKLLTKGLVIRSADKQDRRLIKIRLSSKGEQFILKNNKKYQDQVMKQLKSLSEVDFDLLASSLQNVKDILSKLPVQDTND